MKARKAFLLLLAALTLAACKYDDSELWEQVNQNTARIAALEAWQAETNTNIQALQTLLSTTDYITAVTPVVQDGVEVGYTISFLHTPAITIYHGTKGDKGDTGDTPQIGAAQAEDGNWYWTLNGEFLTDTDGNPIRANGTQGEQGPAGDDAPLPQLATGAKLTDQGITTDSQNKDIEPDAIYLSVDGGKTWTRVSGEDGEKGDTGDTGPKGDSFFEDVDIDDDCVTFYLSEGGFFSVPRYVEISLTFDQQSLELPTGSKFTIECTVTGIDDPTPKDLYLIAVPDGWKAVINNDLTITITAPDTDSTGEILVMLDNKKGNTTIGRIFVSCGTVLTVGNLQPGDLATLIGSHTDLTSITVTSGTINKEDWEAVRKNIGSLTYIDLEGATYTGDDAANFVYRTTFDHPLQTIKLPKGVTGIGHNAFYMCSSLTSITLPDGLTSIGNWAFEKCSALPSITLPDGLQSIELKAFQNCFSLTSIDIPATVTSIGNNAFYNCSAMQSITLPDGLQSIGLKAFQNCFSLHTVTCLAEIPPTLGSGIFFNCDALTAIQVPAGSVEDYKQAVNWSTYADKIVTIPEP